MHTQYEKKYSRSLGRDMETKLYGHDGQMLLFIPCQDGRFYDFEDFGMCGVLAPWIDAGRLRVLSVDTMDRETWSNVYGDARTRSCRHEAWMNYITNEVVPGITAQGIGSIKTFGISLGATHALNLFLRRPDLFDGCLALSGIYSASYGFGGYMDDLVYMNSPVDYMPGLPKDHPYVDMFNHRKCIICCGQGPWEAPESTRRMGEIFRDKSIKAWVDLWGHDVSHDWCWWYKQTQYFMPYLLGER